MPDIAPAVLRWHAAHGRHHLPWQGTREPYRVWLSEIMLQQTQVATVIPYWQRFIATWPDVQSLAAAPQDAVLALWSGLGYYARARNLHRCAREVVERCGGHFPRRAADLARLPGIGRSTAAAIAAFCHGERVPILDANVRRVLCRLFAFDEEPARASAQRQLWHWAEQLCPRAELARAMPAYTQAMMDLGASVCLPRQPRCPHCPLQPQCRAARAGTPQNYPARAQKTRASARRAQTWWLLLAVQGGSSLAHGWRVWLERRPDKGIWPGLYAPPVFASRAALQHAAAQRWNMQEDGAAAHGRELPPFVHALTHRDLHLHPVLLPVRHPPSALQEENPAGRWAAAADWPLLGLPAPVRRLLDGMMG